MSLKKQIGLGTKFTKVPTCLSLVDFLHSCPLWKTKQKTTAMRWMFQTNTFLGKTNFEFAK